MPGTLYQCILTESLQLLYEVGTAFQVDEIQVFDQGQTAGSRVGLKRARAFSHDGVLKHHRFKDSGLILVLSLW